jgi:hypothetical protein
MGRELEVARTPQTEQNLTKKHAVYLYTNATATPEPSKKHEDGQKIVQAKAIS